MNKNHTRMRNRQKRMKSNRSWLLQMKAEDTHWETEEFSVDFWKTEYVLLTDEIPTTKSGYMPCKMRWTLWMRTTHMSWSSCKKEWKHSGTSGFRNWNWEKAGIHSGTKVTLWWRISNGKGCIFRRNIFLDSENDIHTNDDENCRQHGLRSITYELSHSPCSMSLVVNEERGWLYKAPSSHLV